MLAELEADALALALADGDAVAVELLLDVSSVIARDVLIVVSKSSLPWKSMPKDCAFCQIATFSNVVSYFCTNVTYGSEDVLLAANVSV